MASRLDNAEQEVETGSSNTAACSNDVRRPVRKLSVGDLHIRSRDADPTAACREIREILREIRDSLLLSDGIAENTSAGNHAAAAPLGTPNCVHKDVQLRPHPTDVEQRQNRDTQRSGWRHCRLSLPARLRPGQVDGLVKDGVDGVWPSRVGRRRVPANVRFADEVGMNLNTFAMIPSRQVRDDSPTCVPLPWPSRRRPRSPPPRPQNVCINGCEEHLADGQIRQLDDELRSVEEDQKTEINHEQFQLCFKQPFAELDQFRYRLDRQLVCLENVRVDDWAAGAPHNHGGTTSNSLSVSTVPHHSSSMAANSVILCSIQTKNTCGRDYRDAKVFARCTSDNWRTYADLPAQRVTGLDSLGLGYDRYCFAVRRPVTPDPRAASPCDAAAVDGPIAAVEFAVCYQLSDGAFWDNNDEANYRIEWFQNPT